MLVSFLSKSQRSTLYAWTSRHAAVNSQSQMLLDHIATAMYPVPCPMTANRLRMPSRLLDLCLCICQMLHEQQQEQLDLSVLPCCCCSLIKTKTKIDGCMQYERVIFLDCSTWIIWLPTSNKLDIQLNKTTTITAKKAIGFALDAGELIWKTWKCFYSS